MTVLKISKLQRFVWKTMQGWPENYCESKQTYFSYSLDKAFHSPESQAKLFFTGN